MIWMIFGRVCPDFLYKPSGKDKEFANLKMVSPVYTDLDILRKQSHTEIVYYEEQAPGNLL